MPPPPFLWDKNHNTANKININMHVNFKNNLMLKLYPYLFKMLP